MKTILKYVAIDGKEFEDKDKCSDYESLIDTVNAIMAQLPAKPTSTNFTNGEGYLLHDKSIIKSVRNQILELCKHYIDSEWIQQTIDNVNIHPSWVARLLSDYNISPLSNAWYRIQCIDKDGKEWGQIFFVENQDKAKQIQIN